jgi:hypothetical protein
MRLDAINLSARAIARGGMQGRGENELKLLLALLHESTAEIANV